MENRTEARWGRFTQEEFSTGILGNKIWILYTQFNLGKWRIFELGFWNRVSYFIFFNETGSILKVMYVQNYPIHPITQNEKKY